MYAEKQEFPGYDLSPAACQIVARIDDLAVLPHVVFKVLELSGSADSAATDMERAITVDPAFSAKLLTHANSAYYGLARKVTSIRDAIFYLGFKAVREMAMTVGIFDMFVGKNDKDSLRRRAWWRHSVDAAIACRFIAESTHRMDPAEAYTCGLLHYIGKTLLDRFGGANYAFVEQRIAIGMPEIEAELRTYGCNHVEVSIGAGRKWGLPENILASFQYIDGLPANDELARFAACVALGSAVAKIAVEGPGCADALPAWALDRLAIAPCAAQDICDHAVARIANATTMQF